jgi:DNA-binding MarR family transcriptional regulator
MIRESSDTQPWYETIVIPALLRHARSTYGRAMRTALAAAGYDDIPRNGLYVIGGLALGAGDVPLGQLIRELRVSKQSTGQLVDMLVLRGYLDRSADPDDRRRQRVVLTERGRAAAEVQAGARARIDAALAERIGEESMKRMRQALAVIIDLGHGEEISEDEG